MVYTALRGEFLKKYVNFMVYLALRGEFLKKYASFIVYTALRGEFLKKYKFHGLVGPPAAIFLEKDKQPAKPSMSFFSNCLLSHSDTGFRIYATC